AIVRIFRARCSTSGCARCGAWYACRAGEVTQPAVRAAKSTEKTKTRRCVMAFSVLETPTRRKMRARLAERQFQSLMGTYATYRCQSGPACDNSASRRCQRGKHSAPEFPA